VLDRCRVAKIPKIIFPSTAAVYGKATVELINEQYKPNPCTVYGWHKLIGEQLIEAYHMSYGVKYVILRLFNVYGIGNKGVIPYFLKLARETKKIEGFGGHQLRDFVHVEEVANALYLSTVIDDVENKIINIGTGLGITMVNLAKMIGEFYPGTEITFKENMNYMPYHVVADPTLAKKLLGFKPHNTLDFLKKMIKEIDDHERK
jgi:UDP-glucose 4-epimerase